MDTARPYKAICPTLDGEVLNVLAGTDRPLTGREVARLTGRESHRGVLTVLNRLSGQGVVDRQIAGRALLYTLNREHVATPAVELLAGIRSELIARIVTAIDSWTIAPVHLSLFGSFARGEGDSNSDIDVFVVRPKSVPEDDAVWNEQIDELLKAVWRWTGNSAGMNEIGERDLAGLRVDEPPIVGNLRNDAICLFGPDTAELFGR